MRPETEPGAASRGDAITLRDVAPEDEAFLFALYASTREEELAPLNLSAVQREAFLRMQFDAQRTHYAQAYPRARHSLILRDGRAIGRIWVERNEDEIRILDLALLPAHRGAGTGTHLLRAAQREAAARGLPLRHSVEKNNPNALRLYLRLGFAVVGEIPTHYFMEHRPSS